MTSKKIYCVGGATIDKKLKSFGPLQLETSNPVSTSTSYGGVAQNVARNLIQLTTQVHLQCVVGNDPEGQRLLADLVQSGIHCETSLMLDNEKTAYYYAILQPHGELCIALTDMKIYDKVPSEFFIQSWRALEQKDIIFLDTNFPAPLIEQAIKISDQRNLMLCIDPVSTWKARKLPSVLTGIFLLKPDRFEAEVLADMSIHSIQDGITAGKILCKKGVKNTVISLGQLGFVVVNEGVALHYPAITVETIRDVTGAGDAFMAGILFELQQGSAILRACELGAALAAFTLKSQQSVAKLDLKQVNTLREQLSDATVF